jgi:2-phosphosulfolactate phosphatase
VTTTAEMSTTERPRVYVHLLPSLIPPGSLRGGVAVVVDVLRATTVMVHALANGCEAVIPCGEIDEAQAVAAGLPKGKAILGGERGGLPIPGFDLGNSPGDFTREVCEGKTLVMTTTNGTRAILASLEADRVLVGSFANVTAIWDVLKKETRPIHIVCAGTDGRVALEDALLAGELTLNLCAWQGGVRIWSDLAKVADVNDQAMLAAAAGWELVFPPLLSGAPPLESWLSVGRGGRRVAEIGLGADIKAAADRTKPVKLVAELRRDPLRIVAVR